MVLWGNTGPGSVSSVGSGTGFVAPLCEGCCRRKTTLLYGEGSLLLVEGAGSAGSLDGATVEMPLVRPNDGRLETMEIVAEREKPVGAEERLASVGAGFHLLLLCFEWQIGRLLCGC